MLKNDNSLKFVVFGSMYIGYMVFILARRSFTFAMPTILANNLADKRHLGLVTSCFSLSYASSKLVSGILSDHVSPKLLFIGGLVLSACLNILFSLSSVVTVWCILWMINGLAQGVAWPACSKLLKLWFCPSEFGKFWSLLSTSMNVAGGTGAIIIPYVIFHSSWQLSLSSIGILGLLVASICCYTIRTHSDYETPDKIKMTEEKGKENENSDTDWKELFCSPYLLILTTGNIVARCIEYTLNTWAQIYLTQDLHLSYYMAGVFNSCFEVGGIFGSILAGYLADKAILLASNKNKNRGSPRMLVVIGFYCILSLSLLIFALFTTSVSSYFYILFISCLLGMGVYGPVAILGVLAFEFAPSHLSGTSHSVMALGGNIGKVLAGFPVTLLVNLYNWPTVFLLQSTLASVVTITLYLVHSIESKSSKSKTR